MVLALERVLLHTNLIIQIFQFSLYMFYFSLLLWVDFILQLIIEILRIITDVVHLYLWIIGLIYGYLLLLIQSLADPLFLGFLRDRGSSNAATLSLFTLTTYFGQKQFLVLLEIWMRKHLAIIFSILLVKIVHIQLPYKWREICVLEIFGHNLFAQRVWVLYNETVKGWLLPLDDRVSSLIIYDLI